MNNSYTKDSIESLSPLEFTRLRPAVYCGSTEYSTQLLIEIVSNAVDEFKAGHGNCIKIDVAKDNVITVEDNAQGFIPNAKRDDGKTVLEASFSVLNTSGKYSEDGVYSGTALGLNGIGSKLATYLSHWLEVTSWRDGKFEHIWFKEGIFQKRETGKWTDKTKPNGTLVKWLPSEEFFTHSEINETDFVKLIKVLVCLCPSLKILYNNEEYFSTKGINDLVDEATKNKEIIKNRFNLNWAEGKNEIELVMTYTSNYSPTIIPYVNTGLTDSGPHITQLKTYITKVFNKFLRDKKWLKDKEENLTGDDIQEGLYLVFNITAPNIGYDAQIKSRITKIDMKPFIGPFVIAFEEWLEANEKEVKNIADKALNARKAREAAKKARDSVRQPKEKKKQFLNLPSKLVDCWGKDRASCELFIVEGDSAAGGLVEGRDAEHIAVFPVRGKIIAAYKAAAEKVFANAEVINLIKAIGLDLDSKTHKLIYDKKKLRYGKIMLAADADPDGASIRNLLIELFWWLCPELIENGHIYTTMPPLFRITTKKNKYIFLKDAAALEEYKLQHQGETFQINRNKGLGEQDATELAEALLNPETRNVAKLVVENKTETANLIEILLGPSVPPRREFLLKHSEEANDND